MKLTYQRKGIWHIGTVKIGKRRMIQLGRIQIYV